MIQMRRGFILGVVLLGLWAPNVQAQQQVIFQSTAAAPPAPESNAAPAAPAYTQQQLDQMLAPIALYPDPLVGQILMASTYPLEVVEADRWLQNPQNAALKGDQLGTAMVAQPWDPSVKSLVAFPQVLSMMDHNLQWTEQLGDAFLAQQPVVMDTVQHLRQMAQTSGHLSSTPQETVATQDGAIVIEPPTPQTVYIPYYNPSVVYGVWPYPDYQPYYFPAPPGYVYYDEGLIGFGVGVVIVDALWGWDHWDWRGHRIDIDDHRWENLDGHRPPPRGGVWQHDPAHRHGVPYRSAAARAQFGAASAQARSNFRGFSARTENTNASIGNTAVRSHTAAPQAQTHAATFQSHQPPNVQFHQSTGRTAPVFESFSRGQEVHTQAARGAASMATMHAAPQGGGNRGGESHDSDRGTTETRH